MCSIHRKTGFRRVQVVQECLQTMRRSLDLQRGVLASVMGKVSTFRLEAPAIERNCDSVLSSSWPLPIAHFPASLGFQCCRAFGAEGGSRYWILAQGILSPRELTTWLRLPGTGRRRREWLLGRLAAKDALRLFMKSQHGLELSPTDIEISTDEHGRPIVGKKLMEKLRFRLFISIAHSGREAVAIAGECSDHRGAGIDVEPLERSHEGLEEIAFTAEEGAHLSAAPLSRRKEWLLRLWCSKEAVAKALGRGMIGNPRNLFIQDVDVETGRITVGIAGELAQKLSDYVDKPLVAYTGRDGTLVFASSLV